jgi:hypothetical protein
VPLGLSGAIPIELDSWLVVSGWQLIRRSAPVAGRSLGVTVSFLYLSLRGLLDLAVMRFRSCSVISCGCSSGRSPARSHLGLIEPCWRRSAVFCRGGRGRHPVVGHQSSGMVPGRRLRRPDISGTLGKLAALQRTRAI